MGVCVCEFERGSVHVNECLFVRVRARLCQPEDGADVHAAAALARRSERLRKEGIFPPLSLFVSDFTGRPNGHRHASKINK